MPNEPPRRIILEKSRTVKRRYQRSNQRFQFTASQIERLDREQEREKKAKQLREKEKKRIANKKRKAEQEARAREERKRRGLPDPNAARVPSSQPLLSMFLGAGKRQSPAVPEPAPEPTTTETESHGVDVNGSNTELGSEGGDTEADSDAFDDLDEELENELSLLQDAGVMANTEGPAEPEVDSDAFDDLDEELENELAELQDAGVLAEIERPAELEVDSDAFDDLDEELENELAELQDAGVLAEIERPAELERHGIGVATKPASKDNDEFSDCSAFDDDIIKEAEAIIVTRTTDENIKNSSPAKRSPLLQPPSRHRPTVPTLQSSFGESFQFDPADFLEAEAAIISQTNDDETKDQSTSKGPSLLEPPMSDRPRNMPSLASSLEDSFRDETADWIEEAFAHGSGDPFGDPNQISS
jgi:hypothetical protein